MDFTAFGGLGGIGFGEGVVGCCCEVFCIFYRSRFLELVAAVVGMVALGALLVGWHGLMNKKKLVHARTDQGRLIDCPLKVKVTDLMSRTATVYL